MIFSSIDIGTNTVLLLVADIAPDGTMETLAYEQRTPRLGQGVDAERTLSGDSMNRVIDVLLEYREIIRTFDTGPTVVAGTSAVRDARNRQEFSELVREKTGFTLEVLTGEVEAIWTFRGATSGSNIGRPMTVLDIGGGSTEITTGAGHRFTSNVSLNVGSVRLTERFFRSDPPSRSDLDEAERLIKRQLAAHPIDCAESELIGVAGTAVSLAILDQGLREFARTAVAGYEMSFSHVERLFGRLSGLSSVQINALSDVMVGREDIITAGTLILMTVMSEFGFDQLLVSERGIRYGLVLREWERTRTDK